MYGGICHQTEISWLKNKKYSECAYYSRFLFMCLNFIVASRWPLPKFKAKNGSLRYSKDL